MIAPHQRLLSFVHASLWPGLMRALWLAPLRYMFPPSRPKPPTWACRCGWSGPEPEVKRCAQPIGRAPGEMAFRSYDAPLCPDCGRYFSEREFPASAMTAPIERASDLDEERKGGEVVEFSERGEVVMLRTFQVVMCMIILHASIPEMPNFFYGFGMFLAGLLAGHIITDLACDYEQGKSALK